MPYYKSDVAKAKAKIAAACPDVKLEDWQDYGFRLTGYKVNVDGETMPATIRTVLQPYRPENGQPEIIADVDELIKCWSK